MSLETYECSRCGAKLGITGPGSGTEDDYAAEEYFASEVEYHETGQCAPRAVEVAPVAKPDPRAEYIAGLRALADLLEQNEILPLPYEGTSSELTFFTYEREQAQAFARLLPGKVDKEVTDSNSFGFELHGAIHGLRVLVYADREKVCRRVVKGVRTEVRTEDITQVIGQRSVPVEVEDVEWVCEPLLAGAVVA